MPNFIQSNVDVSFIDLCDKGIRALPLPPPPKCDVRLEMADLIGFVNGFVFEYDFSYCFPVPSLSGDFLCRGKLTFGN